MYSCYNITYTNMSSPSANDTSVTHSIGMYCCTDSATLPSKAYPYDAGFDICSDRECVIDSHCSALVSTGLKINLPPNIEAQVRPRSGLALRHQVTVLNTPGTIDPGYQGQIGVILINHGQVPFTVTKGMRIAQLVFQPILDVSLVSITQPNTGTVSSVQRGERGFGSSGH